MHQMCSLEKFASMQDSSEVQGQGRPLEYICDAERHWSDVIRPKATVQRYV